MLTKFAPGMFSSVFEINSSPLDLLFECDSQKSMFKIDIEDAGHSIVLSADLPGVSKNELDITVEDGILTVSGERKFGNEEKSDKFFVSERSFGKFSRSIKLPVDIDESSISAALKDGILTVTLQKKEEAKPRKIVVK